MKIKEIKVEQIKENYGSLGGFKVGFINKIAKCARICYGEEYRNRTAGFEHNKKLFEKLQRNNHLSMFRHAPVYMIVPINVFNMNKYGNNPFIHLYYNSKNVYVSCNYQTYIEQLYCYKQYIIDYLAAENLREFVDNELLYYTFSIETGIDITRELNRVSPNAIAERSTRYVDFNKKFGIIFKKCHWMYNLNLYKKALVWLMAKTSELFYKISRSKYGLNLPPQDARWILPLDTMSKVVYTYTVAEWRHIMDLRVKGITGKPHPDAKAAIEQIKHYLKEEGYEFDKI